MQLKFLPEILPKSLGRCRCRWVDNIKMDLQELGWGTWTGLSWLRRDRWQALSAA